ncbi:GNAT family N-acetyltransferase [Thermoflavimicrobium dichotomicum]|uniref:Predicted N-acetyltransferase YhbS n=1 Tax=Thermoflavimicrobium dichotomicum TaxID=46223 RepID=A0A1I3RP02_9BACL|nr:GNAT family N-acetyltransferase [Thermoflavimicrobium dichotomicum]SFJ46926.1 Predicted N-acetyltransferase YhbS [Thermoflavimicrobium dichotomicum]
MSVRVRTYTLADYPGLLQVQREAFPPPFPEELLWSKEQIRSHIETFPEGAMVAEIDGEIVGSATSLIIQYTGEPHTWAEVADHGFIRNSHQPDGDSLYGIDLCVRPSFRGRGVARALYEARKALVRRLGLKRFLAGCRIPGYHQVHEQYSAEEYVEKVKNGELNDLVLTFMIKQGMRPLQVLPEYLEDEESLNFAVLVEWQNPDLKEG